MSVAYVGFRLPVGEVEANLLETDPAHVLGGGLPDVGSRGKRVPLRWFGFDCLRPLLQDVGPPGYRVRHLLSRCFGLQHV